jgi:hypothetical protein
MKASPYEKIVAHHKKDKWGNNSSKARIPR